MTTPRDHTLAFLDAFYGRDLVYDFRAMHDRDRSQPAKIWRGTFAQTFEHLPMAEVQTVEIAYGEYRGGSRPLGHAENNPHVARIVPENRKLYQRVQARPRCPARLAGTWTEGDSWRNNA